MPVRIRLSRAGAKKRPFYKVVIADSRRARDGKFIEQIGTYNPMLSKDNPDRVKINTDKAKYWIEKGAQPSDRLAIFLSNMGIMDKPIITKKTKKHLPKAKKKTDTESKSKSAEDTAKGAKQADKAAPAEDTAKGAKQADKAAPAEDTAKGAKQEDQKEQSQAKEETAKNKVK